MHLTKLYVRPALLMLAMALLCRVAMAQPPARITMEQAIDLALTHNHTFLGTQTQIQQNQAQEITAALHPNPQLAWDGLFFPLDPSNFNADDINNTQQFDIGVNYLFERGGKRRRRVDAARDATAVTRFQVSDAQRGLILNVTQQFIAVQLAESNLDIAQKDLASFQQTSDIADYQYKAGAISEGDLLKIKLQLLQFQTDVSSAKLAKVQALAALRQMLGYNAVPDNFDVDGELAYQPLAVNLDDLDLRALKLRPDLLEAQQGVRAAQSQIALAKANGAVDLTSGVTYTHISGQNTMGINVSIPLPVFDRNQGEIARTRFALTQAQQLADAANGQVLTDVRDAYEAFLTSQQVVQLYTSGYLKQAQDSRDISEYAYKRGAVSLLDFLDAERSYRATQLAYRQALADYLTAIEQLKAAVGTRTLP